MVAYPENRPLLLLTRCSSNIYTLGDPVNMIMVILFVKRSSGLIFCYWVLSAFYEHCFFFLKLFWSIAFKTLQKHFELKYEIMAHRNSGTYGIAGGVSHKIVFFRYSFYQGDVETSADVTTYLFIIVNHKFTNFFHDFVYKIIQYESPSLFFD